MSTGARRVSLFVAVCTVVSVIFLYSSKSYYPDHPVPGMSKAELLSAARNSQGRLSKLTEQQGAEWYAYLGNQGDGGRELILAMEQRQWAFREQLGSGYIFEDSSGRKLIVESEMWTRKYVLYEVPAVFASPALD